MKVVKFLIIVLIFFIAGFFAGQGYQGALFNQLADNQVAVQPEKITLVIQFTDTQDIEIQNIEPVSGQSVLGLLTEQANQNNLELSAKDYGDLGALVNKIGDKENGQENKYWQYWVNGEQVMVGADAYQLTGGERVEWKFVESKF